MAEAMRYTPVTKGELVSQMHQARATSRVVLVVAALVLVLAIASTSSKGGVEEDK